MPKNSPLPRLSIVVPVLDDRAAFENSLVSVLENRPDGCEIIVAHDGSYDDPFELSDEVRFVTGPNRSLVDLVTQSAAQCRGRFVHVLADGVCATEGWTDLALEKFEHHDAAAVAPVVRHLTGSIVAAGWHDTGGRLCVPSSAGETQVAGHAAARSGGAYLQASFWRRDVIRSLTDAWTSSDAVETTYAFGWMIRAAGWRCVLATDCGMSYEREQFAWDTSSVLRGRRLRAIRQQFQDAGWGTALSAAAKACFGSLLGAGTLGEALGQATAPLAAAEMGKRLRPNDVIRCEDQMAEHRRVIPMPVRSGWSPRRAA